MPIYDYGCRSCGALTEVIHGINDPGPRFCPNCGAEGSMRKALSAPAIVFKGSGWAKVDRRSSSGGSRSTSSTSKAASGAAAGGAAAGGSGSTGPSAGGPGTPGSTASSGGGTASPSEGGGD